MTRPSDGMYFSARFVTLACIFVTCLIMANILAVKLTEIDGRVIDAGNVVFPISYIIGDVVTEVWGFKAARRIIWTGFFCNLIAALAIQAAIHLPSAGFFGDQQAYEDILGFSLRLLGASFCAFLAGEFTNSVIMARMKVLTEGRWLWSRTISSTAVAEAIDSTVFITLAFAGTDTPLLNVIITNWVFKTGYEVLATPLTYGVVNYLKRVEGVDVYDRDTKLLPVEIR
ncbi:MAG: queuosine precursor transporter [Gaiellales bacterium]|nr:queuosine precursor transporter [Gaiellales bacterium]